MSDICNYPACKCPFDMGPANQCLRGLRRITHQPKGGMCTNCVKVDKDCSSLDFTSMPVIGMCDRVKIVKCTMFERVKSHA